MNFKIFFLYSRKVYLRHIQARFSFFFLSMPTSKNLFLKPPSTERQRLPFCDHNEKEGKKKSFEELKFREEKIIISHNEIKTKEYLKCFLRMERIYSRHKRNN